MWRHVSRDWGALRAMVLALLASGGCAVRAVYGVAPWGQACAACPCLPAEVDSSTYVRVARTWQNAWLCQGLGLDPPPALPNLTFCPASLPALQPPTPA